jgi:hypothetical protein
LPATLQLYGKFLQVSWWPQGRDRNYPDRMWGWIWVVALYVFGIGFFHWLGGVGAASDAIQRWGQVTAEKRRTTPSKS